MAKCVIILSFILAAFAASKVFSEKVETSSISSDRLEEILEANPNSVELEQTVVRKEHETVKGAQWGYYIGKPIPGERLILYYNNSKTFSSPQNVELTVKYPAKGGKGVNFTFADIKVTTSSKNYGDYHWIEMGDNSFHFRVKYADILYFNTEVYVAVKN